MRHCEQGAKSCIIATSPFEFGAAKAQTFCQLNNCAGFATYGEFVPCMVASCGSELDICWSAVPSGTANCAAFFSCSAGCSADEECLDSCIMAATPQAYGQAQDISFCVQASIESGACTSGDDACLYTVCAVSVEGCGL